jgi:hypothetical protein
LTCRGENQETTDGREVRSALGGLCISSSSTSNTGILNVGLVCCASASSMMYWRGKKTRGKKKWA